MCPSWPVLATVALKGVGLIAGAKARSDVRLVEVTPENRDSLPAELEAWARTACRKEAGERQVRQAGEAW